MNDKQATPERPKYNRDRIRHDIEHHVSIDLDTKTMEEVIDCVEDAITLTKWFADDETPDGGWVDVRERLPEDFNADGRTPYYLVWVDNPFFKDNHLHTACLMKSPYGSRWSDIETNVHRFPDDAILITHWMPPPPPPQRVETNNDLTT